MTDIVERLNTAAGRALAMSAEAKLSGNNWAGRWASCLTEQAKDNREAADIIEVQRLALELAYSALTMPTPPIDTDKATVAGAAMWEGERKQVAARIDTLLTDKTT